MDSGVGRGIKQAMGNQNLSLVLDLVKRGMSNKDIEEASDDTLSGE